MNIQSLGNLEPDSNIPEWLVSSPIPIPLFNGLPLRITFDGLEDEDESEVNTAIEAFLHLGAPTRSIVSPYVYRNYQHATEIYDEAHIDCRIDSHKEVWDHIHPAEIFVSRRSKDAKIYIQVNAECDWEKEHGLQLVFREGFELSRVSQQDGHRTYTDAYNLPEDQDKIM